MIPIHSKGWELLNSINLYGSLYRFYAGFQKWKETEKSNIMRRGDKEK